MFSTKTFLAVLLMLTAAGGVALYSGGGRKDVAGATGSDGAELKPQTRCPVMGGPINQAVYVDYQGKRVYFCCPGCTAQFQADPERYLKVLAERGEAPADAPPPVATASPPAVTPGASPSPASPHEHGGGGCCGAAQHGAESGGGCGGSQHGTEGGNGGCGR